MNSKIILNAEDQIACPHCNSEFPIREAIAKHLIEKHEDEYQQLLSKELVSLQDQAAKYAEKSIAKTFKKQIETLQEQLAESQDSAKSLQARIAEEKKKAEDKIRESVKLEHDALEESLKSKEEQLAKFREQELALRKAKTELGKRKGSNLDFWKTKGVKS